jgi:hypothetical protein
MIMRKSKFLFIILAIVFFVILALIAIDISSRTSFPGQNNSSTEQEDSEAISPD